MAAAAAGTTTVVSPPSPNDDDDDLLPTATLALPSATAAPSSTRRLPPPCWSTEETVALIDAYREKWYSLRRGNLRANHWQEVAGDVAARCPGSATKTAVQCRHKMEKLRKRYRADVQRAAAGNGGARRLSSSWVHFQQMHDMERGLNSNPNPTPPSSSSEEDVGIRNSVKRIRDLYGQNQGRKPENNGVRIKIPGIVPAPNPQIPKFDKPNFRFGNSAPGINGIGPSFRNRETNPGFDEVIAAIHSLGEGFARSEMAKMEMLKQIDQMRLESEKKRTEMMLKCQQMILEALSDANGSKRARRSSTPPGDGLK